MFELLCRLAMSCSKALQQVALHMVLIVLMVVEDEGEAEAVMAQATSGIGPTRCLASMSMC